MAAKMLRVNESSNLIGYTRNDKEVLTEKSAKDCEGWTDLDHKDAVRLFDFYFQIVSASYRLSEIGRAKYSNWESHMRKNRERKDKKHPNRDYAYQYKLRKSRGY